ncbi:hypothetical protein G9A89_000616 [Geosiphon pyriformis]|nr:hypothetical protein G9A89_000616 [Geosiphon pyriformis]
MKPNFKRREKIFQPDNQQELLLTSRGGGFEKKKKVSLPKRLVKEYRILQLFKEIAYMTNTLYCTRENTDIIGRGFIGSEMIKSQMEKTKFTLVHLLSDIRNKNAFRLDSYWWRSWPDDCFRLFDGGIQASIRTLKNGREANIPIHIVLSGHGIGGFFAQIYGLLVRVHLKYNDNIDITVITFGSPRPGDSQLAADFQQNPDGNLRVYRITHSNDYFPHFPKKSTDGKLYMHPGTEYWIPDKDCHCEDSDADRILEDYDIVYECPEFSPQDKKKYGENLECNLGTDGKGTRAHFGPYFGVTFGDCEYHYPLVTI